MSTTRWTAAYLSATDIRVLGIAATTMGTPVSVVPLPLGFTPQSSSELRAEGYASPLQFLPTSASDVLVQGYAAPLQFLPTTQSTLAVTADNYQGGSGLEALISLEWDINPQIHVPPEVPAGVTPKVYKRKTVQAPAIVDIDEYGRPVYE